MPSLPFVAGIRQTAPVESTCDFANNLAASGATSTAPSLLWKIQPGGVIDFDKGGGVVPVVAVDFTSGPPADDGLYEPARLLRRRSPPATPAIIRARAAALWRKGEESGNFQVVHEIRLDCDNDTLLLAVEQRGDQAACHEGYESCFFRKLDGSDWRIVGDEHKVDLGQIWHQLRSPQDPGHALTCLRTRTAFHF